MSNFQIAQILLQFKSFSVKIYQLNAKSIFFNKKLLNSIKIVFSAPSLFSSWSTPSIISIELQENSIIYLKNLNAKL